MNPDNYGLIRHLRTPDVKLHTLYSDREPLKLSTEVIAAKVMSDENVHYLSKMIIERADPTRNGSGKGQLNIVKEKVILFLTSWKALGKFDRMFKSSGGKQVEVRTVNIVSYVDSLNLEFLDAFAEKILPASQVTKVVSVVNPGGLYAQQERVLKTTAKPTPFYERALYRRLNDFNMDLGLDETENPFYMMDKNPRLSEKERKKTNSTEELQSHLDREGLQFRMIPKY